MGLSEFSGGAVMRLCMRIFLRMSTIAVLCACVSVCAAENFGEDRFDAVIVSVANSYHVDPLLIKAMIWHESRFNPVAEGGAGEVGLMQIKTAVAHDWAKSKGVKQPVAEELFDPYLNIEIGTWYFARALNKWKSSSHALLLALGEYNAGPTKVLRWIRRSHGNTERAIARSASALYVRKIRDKYMEYSLQYADSVVFAGELSPRIARR